MKRFSFATRMFGHVFENHVLPDRFDRGVDFGARKSQALHDRFGHFRADAIMAVETDPAGLVDRAGRRLADIVKENAENERKRNLVRQKLEHQPGMLENVAFGMKLRRLLAPFHRLEFRQNHFHQAARDRADPSRARDAVKEKSAPALRGSVPR